MRASRYPVVMKSSFALLAGLLAGLVLGGLDRTGSAPSLLPEAQASDRIRPEENPLAGADKKAVRCAGKCQEPTATCVSKCRANDNECFAKCGQALTSCMEKCGIDMKAFENFEPPDTDD